MADRVDEREKATMSEATRAGAPAEPVSGGGVGGYLRKGRGRRWLLSGGILVLVVLAGVWWYLSGRESTDDAQVDGHIVPIAARVGGTVADVKVDDNQVVEAGAVLVARFHRLHEVRDALGPDQAHRASAEPRAS